jgi:hypothetical protein
VTHGRTALDINPTSAISIGRLAVPTASVRRYTIAVSFHRNRSQIVRRRPTHARQFLESRKRQIRPYKNGPQITGFFGEAFTMRLDVSTPGGKRSLQLHLR